MKKHLGTVLFILIFLAGLAVLLYPTISEYVNSLSRSRLMMTYDEEMASYSSEDFEDMFSAAREYNRRLLTRPDRFEPSDSDMEEYMSLLNITSGMMGVLTIESIDVSLPIYHGTDESVLGAGVGHLTGSSLPAGGSSTHIALSGHRGLPSARLLTQMDQMKIGDIFVLKILNETFTYEVDQILIVNPDDISNLNISLGKEYCTLITCTPYGINSHRLLVRGFRTENGEAEVAAMRISASARQIDSKWVTLAFAVPALLVLFVLSIIRKNRRQN